MKKRKAKVNSFCGRAARWVNAHLLRPFGLVLVQDMHIARPRSCRNVAYAGTDFIRYNTLGLLAQEIRQNKVPGACAELGVFQGDFACEISKLLPERKIYLYDTFEGFATQDLTTEQARKFSLADECFANTDVALVRAKMPHINQCVFRKGIFPQSAQQDGQERFCLVSLDADLYEPLYAGLKFFTSGCLRGDIYWCMITATPAIKVRRRPCETLLANINKTLCPFVTIWAVWFLPNNHAILKLPGVSAGEFFVFSTSFFCKSF